MADLIEFLPTWRVRDVGGNLKFDDGKWLNFPGKESGVL